jgi:hypothetical protein
MSSNSFKKFLIMLLASIGLLAVGCTTTGPLPAPPPSSLPGSPPKAEKPVIPQIPEGPKEPEEPPGPRAMASLQMTEQGRVLLEQKKVDDAIRVLERAVSLNSGNGQNYYYLAEAWFFKKNIKQAEEFNSLAGIYLEGDQTWMPKVEEQKNRIQKFSLAP